VITLKGIWIV